MAAPPQNVPPSELWTKLQAFPRPSLVVDYPRKDADGTPIGQLAIWPLTAGEQIAANVEADRFAKRLLKEAQQKGEANFGYEHTFSTEGSIQTLFRACRVHNDLSKALFPSPAKMRETLAVEELSALYRIYCTVQVELGPTVTALTDEEYEQWIVELAKGGSAAAPFALLSLEVQLSLVAFMASRLVSSSTATSSAGSPLESTETASLPEDGETTSDSSDSEESTAPPIAE